MQFDLCGKHIASTLQKQPINADRETHGLLRGPYETLTHTVWSEVRFINPHPANVENMVSS